MLAIDLGTSGPKVAVVSVEAEVLGWETERTALHLSEGGGAEQDPEDWWRAICVASRAVLEATGLSGGRSADGKARIVAVSVTAQWAGTVAVDGEGKALRPAITWMDSRGARYMDAHCGGALRVEGYGVSKLVRWIRRTGGAPSLVGKEPTAHLLWLRHNEPEVFAAAAHFLEPKDWINRRLTGRATATTDSICLHWITDNRDIGAIAYDDALVEQLGVPRAKLPELVAATDVIAELTAGAAEDLGLAPLVTGGAAVQVMGGTPDVHSAAVGSGAVGDGELHLYFGTSSWLSGHTRAKKIDLFHNIASLPSALPGRYLIGDSQETAGACFEHLRDHLLFPDDGLSGPPPEDFFERAEALAAAAPAGSRGLIYTPWLYGERCPTPDHTIRAGFHNLSLASTRGELLRSVYEGVAFNTRWLLQYVEKFVGRPAPSIRFIGGGASSALWSQILADVLDRPIEQVAQPRACNARGAALLASLGLNYLKVEDIPARVRVARRYEPRADARAVYDANFAAFLDIYAKNKAIHRRLNGARPGSS